MSFLFFFFFTFLLLLNLDYVAPKETCIARFSQMASDRLLGFSEGIFFVVFVFFCFCVFDFFFFEKKKFEKKLNQITCLFVCSR